MKNSLMPPLDLIHWTGSDSEKSFLAVGQEYFNYFRDKCGLKPGMSVLDIGCGVGRMAIPLLDFLTPDGRFEGIDVDPRSIKWAAENITPRYPNFRFHHSDVFNLTYNAGGKIAPHRYRLPFANETFDFLWGTSVFTHMLPPSMENYLSELARVLKTGGQCLLTFFLLNDSTERFIKAGKSAFHFPHRWGPCGVQSLETPENVVGYDEAVVQQLFSANGLAIRQPISYGYWTGRTGTTNSQDVVIARKERSVGALTRLVRKAKLYRFQKPEFVAEPRFARAA